MSKIHLLGELSKFGEVWETSETKISSVFKLIDCQRDDFKPFLLKALEAGCDFAIVSGSGLEIEEPLEIFLDNVVQEDFYVSLIPAGSGKGWGKILAGIFVAVVSFVALGPAGPGILGSSIQSATAANIGYAIAVNLALQGVTQLLTKVPNTEKEEEGPGLFNGPENTIKSGQPVPILYGELLVGGAPIHVNIGSTQVSRVSLPVWNRLNPYGSSYTQLSGSPYTAALSGYAEGSGDETSIVQSDDFSQIEFDWGTVNNLGLIGSIGEIF